MIESPIQATISGPVWSSAGYLTLAPQYLTLSTDQPILPNAKTQYLVETPA